MKFVIGKLRKGEIVEAEVVEIVSPTSVIVNFSGDLIRVVNETGKPMQVGERYAVRVVQVNPLQFQLAQAETETRQQRQRLDVDV